MMNCNSGSVQCQALVSPLSTLVVECFPAYSSKTYSIKEVIKVIGLGNYVIMNLNFTLYPYKIELDLMNPLPWYSCSRIVIMGT